MPYLFLAGRVLYGGFSLLAGIDHFRRLDMMAPYAGAKGIPAPRLAVLGDAERLYERLGWERVGAIPGYALLPQGGLCDTTVYYRNLGG
jgi:uncharacterized membrane protein YphA (DoxX/SURF4 family)